MNDLINQSINHEWHGTRAPSRSCLILFLQRGTKHEGEAFFLRKLFSLRQYDSIRKGVRRS